MSRILNRRNIEVKSYQNPVETPVYQCRNCPCSLKAKGVCPDLIISDFNMPTVNGVELLESLVGKGCRCRHLALISGDTSSLSHYSRVAKFGTRYFTKPLDIDDFYDWLDRVELDTIQQHSRPPLKPSSGA